MCTLSKTQHASSIMLAKHHYIPLYLNVLCIKATLGRIWGAIMPILKIMNSILCFKNILTCQNLKLLLGQILFSSLTKNLP